MTYALWRPRPDIVQITLPNPGLPLPWALPCNVYVVLGQAPCLVNTGHPAQREALVSALGQLGIAPGNVERVVATDWSPEALGNAALFEDADLFVRSDDMRQPSFYGPVVDGWRERWQVLVGQLLENDEYRQAMNLEAHEAALEAYFGGLPERLNVVPLVDGHRLRLGRLDLVVVDAPGPADGHMVLFEDKAPEEQGILFGGRVVVEHAFGDQVLVDVKAMIETVERVFDLKPGLLLPTLGRVDESGTLAVRRVHRNMTSFLSNLPYVLQGPMTLPQILFRDMGYIPSDLTRYLGSLRRLQVGFDELVRTAVLLTEGRGVWTRYGTSAPDPRVSRG